MSAQQQEIALFGAKTDTMPAYLQDAKDAGLGNENVGSEDQTIPRLNLLQALSPQIDEVKEAKAGLFHNSVTDELYEQVFVVNLMYSKEFAIFKKRKLGGGFHGNFVNRDDVTVALGELPGNTDDYDIVETAKHTCLMLDEKGVPVQPVLIYMKSTALNVSRKWNSEINLRSPESPRFATVWKLSSRKQSNDFGTWHNFVAEFEAWTPEDLYIEAKALYEAFSV